MGLELLQGLMLCILPSVVQTFSRLALRLGCSTSPKYVVSTEGAQQVGYVAGLRLSFGQLVGDAPKLMVGKTPKSKEHTQKTISLQPAALIVTSLNTKVQHPNI